MGNLPRSFTFTLGGLDILVVHATPSSMNRFVFPSTPKREKNIELDLISAAVVVGGHCGIPFGQQLNNRYWLNSGVIGMPANDGTTDGWYLSLEAESGGVGASWHRLDYNWEEASRRMLINGLDTPYRKALQTGYWPSMDVLPPHERLQQGIPLCPEPMHLLRHPNPD
jgi:hypothetical protein